MQGVVAHHGREQRGLADAVAADDRERLAFAEREPHVLQHHGLAVAGRTRASSSSARISHACALFAQIDRAHALVGDGSRPACRRSAPRPATRTVMRLATRNTTSMSCSMIRIAMSGSSAGDHVENEMALRRRHAGGGLVEQQHVRAQRQRDRDLDQPLPAVGQFAHELERIVGKPQRIRAGRAPHRSRRARRRPVATAGCRRRCARRPRDRHSPAP